MRVIVISVTLYCVCYSLAFRANLTDYKKKKTVFIKITKSLLNHFDNVLSQNMSFLIVSGILSYSNN